MFARYTTDFDCGYETEWWYCLKDDKMNIESLNAKRRWEIRKGLSLFDVIQTNDICTLISGMYEIMCKKIEGYATYYRPPKESFAKFQEKFLKQAECHNTEFWLAISKESSILCGYAICTINEDAVDLNVVSVDADFEKYHINAAIPYSICYHYLNERGFRYVYDGSRNIVHETNYQDYLIKQVGFRRAYCKLNIIYNPVVYMAIAVLYPFRRIFKGKNKLSKYISSLLLQEKIRRSFK